MHTDLSASGTAFGERFLLTHTLLVPASFGAAAWAIHASGIDQRIAAAFFDPATRTFPAHSWHWFELLGHRFAKTAVAGIWLAIAAAALVAAGIPSLRTHVRLLWATALAMALGPTIVVLMKETNGYRCPWDIVQFGGFADYGRGWFVSHEAAGRCFPSGHAAGGFSLVALFFAGCASGNAGLRRIGLVAALGAGSVFSLVRVAQGAHFLSHNLWSAAIDWFAAALAFAPLVVRTRGNAPRKVVTAEVVVEPKIGARGLRRLILAMGYSIDGLRAVWIREAAFRQEAIAALLLAPIALWLPVSALERCALLASLGFVLVVELLNSAVEAVVDLVSPQPHRLAGLAKDAGSAAVLVALTMAAAVWVIVVVPIL